MALGFTSHYKSGEQAFGALTQSAYANDVEAAGTVADLPSLIVGHSVEMSNIDYDSCEFSNPVVIDYTQYAYVAEGSSSETAGSIASVGGDFGCSSGGGSVASFSAGASFSGSSGGGMSCASFTC